MITGYNTQHNQNIQNGFLRAVGVLFSPMVSGRMGGWVGGRREIICPGCISETVRCRKLILGRDIG